MPLYDVYLGPCVTVKVPDVSAATLADAVTQADAIAGLHQLFAPLNHRLPSGVAWVEWSDECHHALVDTLPLDDVSGDPVASQFLNTANEPVSYGHTTGCWLHVRDDGQVVHTFGPFRCLDIVSGCVRCTPWRAADLPHVFRLMADGLVVQHRRYTDWSVESIDIPDDVGLPTRWLTAYDTLEDIP